MKKLVLTPEETRELKEDGRVEIVRNGFDMVVEEDEGMECGYQVWIINPYEKVVLAKEKKQEKQVEVKEETIKLTKGHLYKFNDRGTICYGVFMGREKGFECMICGKGSNAYSFAIAYHQNTIEEVKNDIEEGMFENFTYGKEHLPIILEDLGTC